MTKKLSVIFCLIFAPTLVISAQSKVVTNEDLARYKAERLNAERELREDYARLGFASPEEMAKRDAKSREMMLDLSAKLRRDRLESEARLAEARRTASPLLVSIYGPQPASNSVIFGSHWYPRYNWRRAFLRQYQQPGYFAGGQFWPTGPRTPSVPMFAPQRKR